MKIASVINKRLALTLFVLSTSFLCLNCDPGSGPGPLGPNPLQNLRIVDSSATSLVLKWELGSDGEDGIVIEASPDNPDNYNRVTTLAQGSNQYTHERLQPRTTYFYRLKTFNQVDSSQWASISKTTMDTIFIPVNFTGICESSTQIHLYWTDRSDNESGFILKKRIMNEGDYGTIRTLPDNSEDYIDSRCSPATSYQYKIGVFNTRDTLYANIITVTTTPDLGISSPYNFRADSTTSSDIYLGWNYEEDVEIDGFVLQRRLEGAGQWDDPMTLPQPLIRTYHDSDNLIHENLYIYRIRAFRDTLLSDWVETSATPSDEVNPINRPDRLTATDIQAWSVSLLWNDRSDNELGFLLYRGSNSGQYDHDNPRFWLNADRESYRDGTEPATTYFYKVAAFNDTDTSYSNEIRVLTLDVPPAPPENLSAQMVELNEILLEWHDASDNEEGFIIERGFSRHNLFGIIRLAANSREYTDIAGLELGETYYYRVSSYNTIRGVENQSHSQTVSVRNITSPVSPSNLTVESTTASEINLSWRDLCEFEQGFIIYRRKSNQGGFVERTRLPENSEVFEDSGLEPRTEYTYRVVAYYDELVSPNPPEITAETGCEATFALDGRTDIEMVWIPAGRFIMGASGSLENREPGASGSEYPNHPVTFNRGFWIGKYEVKQEQWTAVMGRWEFSFEGGMKPAESISWNDIQTFLDRVDNRFRLPSEAEWEYACRGGTATYYFWGNGSDQVGNYAWYSGNSDNQTTIVGEEKLPNPFGLYDIQGNVSEWCDDRWHYNYNDAPGNGSSWIDGESTRRVERGSNYGSPAVDSRSARRSSQPQDLPAPTRGFRLVRED